MIRTLIADDGVVFRRGLRRLLEADGRFEIVAEAADGEFAVVEAERTRPDLVLLDIRMPRCNGLAAARLLHAQLPDTQIVILTEIDSPQYRAEALASGCNLYLLKGDDPAALLDVIFETLELP